MIVRLLPIYGDYDPETLSRIKIAKENLRVDFTCQPATAVPGSPGRILALAEAPNFLCDYALVHDTTSQPAMDAAVRWCLTGIEDKRAVTVLQVLKGIFGAGVRELEPETVEQNVVFK